MPTPPLQIEVYDKNFTRLGLIGAPKFVTIMPVHNGAGRTTVGILGNDRMMDAILTDGERLRVLDETGKHLMSGMIEDLRGTGPSRQMLIEADIVDDFVVLSEMLGWVQPANAITAQGTGGDNWVMTGPAETVLKAAVQANGIDRLGMPIVCAPDLGRGSTITARLRFHPIYDRLFPVLDGAGIDQAGIGVTVKQAPPVSVGGVFRSPGLILDCYTPRVHPRDLTEEGGHIINWSWSKKAPTATDVVIGGQGEAQLRSFRQISDLTRQTAYNRIKERFRDARDVEDPSDLYERGQETLDEGAAKAGFSIELAQTPNFRYGAPNSVTVGDQVTIKIAAITKTDILKDATLSWTQDDGWKTTPKLGEETDNPDKILLALVKKLARSVSNRTRV